MILLFLFITTLFLAYSNGANDNFKGVATLYGSETLSYRQALTLATAATVLGSVGSIFLAERLVKAFSGKGLVTDSVANSPEFLLAVALGAGCTVMLATVLGFPISTTHSLIGALLGSGFMAVGWQMQFGALGKKFILPLVVSPLIAVALAGGVYFLARWLRKSLGLNEKTCLCVETQEWAALIPSDTLAVQQSALSPATATTIGLWEACERPTTPRSGGWMINSQSLLDSAHIVSGGVVCFARGLNDTPKIVALMLAISALGLRWGMLAVAVGMAVGGVLNARRVAETMSRKITPLNHGQGFTANLVTGFLVIFASRMGVPVSTTHVSVGSLFGIGTVTGEADSKVIREILLSWVLTLPVAALLSTGAYLLLR